MGYYTSFYVKTFPEEAVQKVTSYLSGKDKYFEECNWYQSSDSDTWYPGESCKWYSYDEDMKEVSKVFPDVVIELHGEGEEAGDYWYRYYKGGKLIKVKEPNLELAEDMSKL